MKRQLLTTASFGSAVVGGSLLNPVLFGRWGETEMVVEQTARGWHLVPQTLGEGLIPAAGLFIGLSLLLGLLRLHVDDLLPRPGFPDFPRETAAPVALAGLVVLTAVVGPVVGPIGAASAQTTTPTDSTDTVDTSACNSVNVLLGMTNGFLPPDCTPDRTDYEQAMQLEDEQTRTDLLAHAGSVHNQQKAHVDTLSNYYTDLDKVAFQKGQAAYIEALASDPDNETRARQWFVENVTNYLALHQSNLGETWDGTWASAQYINEVAANETGLDDSMVTMPAGADWKGNLTRTNVTLVNGTQKEVYQWNKSDANGTITTGDLMLNQSYWEDFEDSEGFTVDDGTVQQVADAPQGESVLAVPDGQTFAYLDLPDGEYETVEFWVHPNGTVDNYPSFTLSDDTRNDVVTSLSPNANGNWSYPGDAGSMIDSGVPVNADTWTKVQWKELGNQTDNELRLVITEGQDNPTEVINQTIAIETQSTIGKLSTKGETGASYMLDAVEGSNGPVNELDTVYVEGGTDYEDQVIARFGEYRTLWTDLESTNTRLVDNAETLANATYDEFAAGNVTLEDLASNWGVTQEYVTAYNETGYFSYSLMAMQSAGVGGADLNNTSYQTVEYYENGSWHTADGMVLSSEGPTYTPPFAEPRENGTWYTDYEYNATNIGGTQWLVTVDGNFTALEDRFVITEMYDRNGSSINSTVQQNITYETTSADEWVNESTKLAELRAELESLQEEIETTGGGLPGIGGIGLGDLGTAIPVGLVILGGVYLLGRRDN